MGELDIIAQISEMKLIDYKNTLAILGLIEILQEKGIVESLELAKKVQELDELEK